MLRTLKLLAAAFAALWLAACSTPAPRPSASLGAPDAQLSTCAEWYQRLDHAVDTAGVRDASRAPVSGYPYLRVDRFTASFDSQAVHDDAVFDAWFARARALDGDARSVEIDNLPAPALAELGADRAAARARTASCAAKLAAHDRADPAARRAMLEAAVVPDDYIEWQRIAGFYALSAVPFSYGVDRWHAEAKAMFRATRDGAPPEAPLARYAPPAEAALDHTGVAALLAHAPRDALGVPQFTADERERLYQTFAPLFELESGGAYDHPGALYWSAQPVPQVDGSWPTVYRRLAYTRYHGTVLLQLVYTIWFPERPGDDILAGKLDGLVWRVTLTPQGAPLVYDTIHPCGCFHMFFPTALAVARPAPEPMIEWAFVPRTAPELAPPQHIVLRIATRTHYLKGLDVATRAQAARATRLAVADEDALRTLRLAGGGTRSLYGADGLVAGSERPERDLFWPMGIESAGQMRQWGRHATAFVGRRHFDDADLIERRFDMVAVRPTAAK
jgi:hypothetical protein